jgi:outer membrane protein
MNPSISTVVSNTLISKMLPYVKSVAVAIVFAGISMNASAQAKVAFVNTEKLLKESVLAQEAQKALINEFSKRESALVETSAEMKRKADKLERDGSVMSASERQRVQADLADADAKFQRDRRNLEEEIQTRRSQLLSGILERANREVMKVAEAEQIDIVFQEAVWVNPKIDITNKVLDALKR